MKRITIMVLILAVLAPVFAADATAIGQYQMGSQMFTFRAGPVIPLFFYFFNDNPSFVSDTHLKTGGYGSIRYQGFTNSQIAIGGELGYYFAYPRNDDLLTSVPLQFVASWIPVQGTIELPISLGLGFAYNSFAQSSYLSMFASAEIGLSWYFTDQWGITVSAGYWLIPEIYTDAKRIDTSLGNFSPIVVSISYRN
ncbi:MAG: hypothetical protein WC129_02945 [Sphaerochaetaceae bacterium]|jgi:hypothetical protein|nr:hypothetical protein [Sphaerochaetaceae bacterium]MDX9809181.1 hypothetical protein [Sphaerochaetaceae bacterium]